MSRGEGQNLCYCPDHASMFSVPSLLYIRIRQGTKYNHSTIQNTQHQIQEFESQSRRGGVTVHLKQLSAHRKKEPVWRKKKKKANGQREKGY